MRYTMTEEDTVVVNERKVKDVRMHAIHGFHSTFDQTAERLCLEEYEVIIAFMQCVESLFRSMMMIRCEFFPTESLREFIDNFCLEMKKDIAEAQDRVTWPLDRRINEVERFFNYLRQSEGEISHDPAN